MAKQNQFMKALRAELQTLYKRVEELENRDGPQSVSLEERTQNPCLWKKLEKLPKFQRRNQLPMTYLRKLEKFIDANGISGDWTQVSLVLDHCFEDLKWWQVFGTKVTNFNEFQKRFKHEFWGETIQGRKLENIEHGKYSPVYGKMVDYCYDIILIARDLDSSFTDSMLINKIIKHFSSDVQRYLYLQHLTSIEELLDAIKFMDESGVSWEGPKVDMDDQAKGKRFQRNFKQEDKQPYYQKTCEPASKN